MFLLLWSWHSKIRLNTRFQTVVNIKLPKGSKARDHERSGERRSPKSNGMEAELELESRSGNGVKRGWVGWLATPLKPLSHLIFSSHYAVYTVFLFLQTSPVSIRIFEIDSTYQLWVRQEAYTWQVNIEMRQKQTWLHLCLFCLACDYFSSTHNGRQKAFWYVLTKDNLIDEDRAFSFKKWEWLTSYLFYGWMVTCQC